MFKVQPSKLYDNFKILITLTIHIYDFLNTNNAFVAVLVFNLLSRKVLFGNRKDNRKC